MPKPARIQISASSENLYATSEDFYKIFDEDLNRLYQLSFLLTGDRQKAENCFVAGIKACADQNGVFREWARAWTIRIVVENAIRELTPRPTRSNSSAQPDLRIRESTSPTGYFDADTLLWLADFDRFVFVLRLLERYPENECALLLGSSRSQVREACTRAIKKLARID
jgi:DNA-directed RNA polymerase specialized sigma24 family protein